MTREQRKQQQAGARFCKHLEHKDKEKLRDEQDRCVRSSVGSLGLCVRPSVRPLEQKARNYSLLLETSAGLDSSGLFVIGRDDAGDSRME